MPASLVTVASAMNLPDSISFHMFGLDFYWYGILLAAGVILAIVLAHFESRRKRLPADTAIDLCLIALPLGVVGARIAYVLMNLTQFKGRAIEVLYIWEGGLSAVGAVILALAGILLYAHKKRICPLKLFDVITPGINAALAISAWGYFFNQEFYGPPVTNSSLKWFPLCVKLSGGEIHLALFFYLFVWLVLLFAFLWLYLRKRAKHNGDVTLIFVLFYSFGLALLSILRQDGSSRYLLPQIGGGLVFVVALLFLIVRHIREKRLGRLIWPSPNCGECANEPVSVTENAGAEAEQATEPIDAAKKTSATKSKAAKATADKKKPATKAKTVPAKEKVPAKAPVTTKKKPATGKSANKEKPAKNNKV